MTTSIHHRAIGMAAGVLAGLLAGLLAGCAAENAAANDAGPIRRILGAGSRAEQRADSRRHRAH